MQRDPKLYLYDIKQAISAIGEFTAGKTLADYKNELMMRSAVERQVVIIAEAISRMSCYPPGSGSIQGRGRPWRASPHASSSSCW